MRHIEYSGVRHKLARKFELSNDIFRPPEIRVGGITYADVKGWRFSGVRLNLGATKVNGYRVLLVEDDAVTRNALRRLLTHKGWVVTVATTVAEAMDSLNPPPHCILLDLMLPDGGGEEVLRKLRDENIPSKVAVCTGTSDPVRLAMVKGMDPTALFQKPIDFNELCRTMEDEATVVDMSLL